MHMTTAYNGISVVIPCLNEEASIGPVVDAAREGISRVGLPGEVIVVDNGSTDRSTSIARAHGARVVTEQERGYGAALRRGFAEARYDLLAMGDGDLTYDFTRLDDLATPILRGEADFVVGNRMGNLRPGSMPWLHRYIGNPLLSTLLRFMFWNHLVRDAHCGMRVITATAYRALHCVTTGMEFASEMIVRALHCKLRMVERPIIYHPRVGESKLMSFRDGWRHLRFMWLHSPSSALLVPGLLIWVLGLALALRLAMGPVMWNGRAIDIHCMIVGGLLSVISIQMLTMGLLAKAFAHLSGLHHEPVVRWLYQKITFERFVLYTTPLVLSGLALTLWVVFEWAVGGFGPLDQTRRLFFGMLLMANGTQIAAAGYLFSIMALPRHVEPFTPNPPDPSTPPATREETASHGRA